MNLTLYLKDNFIQLKQSLIKYILLKNSIGTLSNTMKRFYILSIGFNEIWNGTKNPKRFKLSIFFCIIMWINVIWNFLIIIIHNFRSYFDNTFFPEYSKTGIFILALVLTIDTTIKTDLLFGEIDGNINALKVFQIIKINLKLFHQLTDKNYKRLAILSRIMIVIFLYYASPLFMVLIPSIIFVTVHTIEHMFLNVVINRK